MSAFRSFPPPEVENRGSNGYQHHDDSYYDGVPVLRDEGDYSPSITRSQVSQDHVSGDSAKRERSQEFSYRILQGACRTQKRNHGHGRRQQSRDCYSGEPPSLEDITNFIHFLAREPMFERFFSPLASEPVRDKASNHRARRRHQSVVKPQLLLARGQDNRCHIHDARQRYEGVVQEPEGNQTYAAEVKEPAPHASYCRWQHRRDYVTGDHLSYFSLCAVPVCMFACSPSGAPHTIDSPCDNLDF